MRHQVIDIYFTDVDGRDDKTQFDFNGDWNDAMGAWETFCDDNGLEFGCMGGVDVYEIDEPEYEEDEPDGYVVGITREDINNVMGYDGDEWSLDPEHMERVVSYLQGAWPHLLEQSIGDVIQTAISETSGE